MARPTNKVERVCEQCGKHFFTIPFFVKRGHGRFCSIQCRGKARSTKIERTCGICGKLFETYPCRIKLGYGKFCSRGCFHKSLEGKPLMKATQRAAEVNRGKPRPQELVERTAVANRGKHRSEKQKQLLSKLAKNRLGERNAFYGKRHSAETRQRLSQAQKENWQDLRYRVKQSQLLKLAWENNPELRLRMSEMRKEQWRDPEYAKRIIDAVISSGGMKPNKLELKLKDILARNFPGEYEYTGDGKLLIYGMRPDFANCNGKKDLIEVFGDYYHSPEVIGDNWRRSELGKIMAYNSLGYRCLVIWEHELKELTEDEIVLKIKNFQGRKYARATHT